MKYAGYRGIGWHVSFRDPNTGTPRKHRFQVNSRAEALPLYHEWLGSFLQGETPPQREKSKPSKKIEFPDTDVLASGVTIEASVGSLLHISSGLLRFEESRVREEGAPRQKGTITKKLFADRKNYVKEFLGFVTSRYGSGAVGSMELADLKMDDIEAYNQFLVKSGYSASQVTKRMLFVRSIVNRAGRPEFGSQALSWNWDSLDLLQGKPSEKRQLPTLDQIKMILQNCDERETAMVWIAIGCGFGQRDIAACRLKHFDSTSFDLRRGKTGVDRYGATPKLVWQSITAYLKTVEIAQSDLLFRTRKGMPLVHEKSDAVTQWWSKLRNRLGKDCESLEGFYVLRHLGATEYGSRKGCSIGDMKRWLGHSATSQVADVYMKPVSPENKPIVQWVRKSLSSGKADLKLKQE